MHHLGSRFMSIGRDFLAGTVVFLVALPLCLGVALASGTPLVSGLIAGVVGGVVVGFLSGSQTSVSGPAAGLTAVVAAQLLTLGSFPAFLSALVIAGLIQIALGAARLGIIAEYIPSSVIKGLLAAIGIILITKQLPFLVGLTSDNPIDSPSAVHAATYFDVHFGACAVGLVSIILLELWYRWRLAERFLVPGPLAVVLVGTALGAGLTGMGDRWEIGSTRLVNVPILTTVLDFSMLLQWPDFFQATTVSVFSAAFTLAGVASLETLLNLDALDKLDPKQRCSPANRELIAQGVGNIVCGLIGGLPVTSVIVRSSVNIQSGAQSKLSSIFHGLLLCTCVILIPTWLNQIPLSCLAAILISTGLKLASPELVIKKLRKGSTQFVPFATTVVAIVAADLLVGVLIGLATATFYILRSNFNAPLLILAETQTDGEWVRIVLPNQVSFLNRARLARALHGVPEGGRVLLDARNCYYIDPDVLEMLSDFKDTAEFSQTMKVAFLGFDGKSDFDGSPLPITHLPAHLTVDVKETGR